MPSDARQSAAEGEMNMKIRNTVISLLLSFSLGCTPVPVRAAGMGGYRCGDNLTCSFDHNTGELTINGTGEMWDYGYYDSWGYWDEEYGGFVRYDDPGSFYSDKGCPAPPWAACSDEIKTVIIDEGVTTVGKNAFANCFELTAVKLPDTMTEIREAAFMSDFILSEINFPDGLVRIGGSAFSDTALTELKIPNSVRIIDSCAFYECTSLRSVELHEGIEVIGDYCFAGCSELEEINFPSTITSVGEGLLQFAYLWLEKQLLINSDFIMLNDDYLYRYFGKDEDVVIPDNVRKISKDCFGETLVRFYEDENGYRFTDETGKYLTDEYGLPVTDDYGNPIEAGDIDPTKFTYHYETWAEKRSDIRSVTLPDSITELPAELFQFHYGLEHVHIGSAVTEIPDYFCFSCPDLYSVDLPEGLLKIGEHAFAECYELTELTIPDSLEEVDSSSFYPSAPFLEFFGDWAVIGNGVLMKYQGKGKVVTVPEGIRTIVGNAFYNTPVVSLTLSSTVRILCENAFDSSMLVDLTLNDGLETIPRDVISGSKPFRYLTIPESVKNIDPLCCRNDNCFTVIGKKGSAAEGYARSRNLPFQDVEQSDGPDMTIDPIKDCWSFKNTSNVFSGSNQITEEDLAILKDAGIRVDDAWSGACFGMCMTILLAYKGRFTARQIDSTASSIGELTADSKVQSMINFYQCLQQTEEFRASKREMFFEQSVYSIIRNAEAISKGASPFMICLDTNSGNRHAVIGYGAEEGSWIYNGREWNHRVLVYDPNKVSFNDDCCMYYDPVTFSVSIPQYEFYWDAIRSGNWLYLRYFDDPDVLNSVEYPFEERFGAPGPQGDLDGDGTLTAKDAECLLDYLLCRTQLNGTQTKLADLNGDSRLTASDLTLLKQKILSYGKVA